jgi:small GTP-binding protein
MLKKKVCLLGAYGVGKTSLVRRFVESIFDERYLTTVGVRLERKDLIVDGEEMRIMLWDLAGEDDVSRLRPAYLQGASACIFVADGTRPSTLDVAETLGNNLKGREEIPYVLAINKHDLSESWAVGPKSLARITQLGWNVHLTSAKSGSGVEEMFRSLAVAMLGRSAHGA